MTNTVTYNKIMFTLWLLLSLFGIISMTKYHVVGTFQYILFGCFCILSVIDIIHDSIKAGKK